MKNHSDLEVTMGPKLGAKLTQPKPLTCFKLFTKTEKQSQIIKLISLVKMSGPKGEPCGTPNYHHSSVTRMRSWYVALTKILKKDCKYLH